MAFAFDEQDDEEYDRLCRWLAAEVEGLSPLADMVARWRAPWRDQAACRATAVDFYNLRQAEAARTVCAGCEVRTECLDAGRAEPAGVWGGLERGGRRAR